MMYYIIYITTNLINGKRYIGKHKTTNIDDGYLGSGTLIKQAIKKYGKENFSKEIIMYCASENEMNLREEEIINESIINDPLYYNLIVGGLGGAAVGHVCSDETKQKISQSQIGKYVSPETRQKQSEWQKGKKLTQESIQKRTSKILGQKRSEETKQKMSAWQKGRPGRKKTEEEKLKISLSMKLRKTKERT